MTRIQQSPENTTRTDIETYTAAQGLFRELYRSGHDAEDAYHLYTELYPKITPEAFRNDFDHDREGRARYQKARELIYGKERGGLRNGGDIGRLRVLAGEPLRQSVLNFKQVNELRPLQYDAFTQFADEQIDLVKSVLSKILPRRCWFVIEKGYYAGLHVHILHGRSVQCPGATLAEIPDGELFKRVRYLVKRPHFDFDTAWVYLTVRQACQIDQAANPIAGSVRSRVATRHSGLGISAKQNEIGLGEIEAVLGVCPGTNQVDVTRTFIKDKIPTCDTYPISVGVAAVAQQRCDTYLRRTA